MAYFSIAGEGFLDLSVGKRLLEMFNHQVIAQYDKRGKDRLDASFPGYLNASRLNPWLVLRDQDNHPCVAELSRQINPNRDEFPQMVLRICATSIESWLLADKTGFSRYFRVGAGKLPSDVEALPDAKGCLINIVSGCSRRNLREGIVPRVGSGRKIGPEYNAVLSSFINEEWNANRASENSESLRRAMSRIEELA